jgi:hypothetical protein
LLVVVAGLHNTKAQLLNDPMSMLATTIATNLL